MSVGGDCRVASPLSEPLLNGMVKVTDMVPVG